jgi:hypothetical protein
MTGLARYRWFESISLQRRVCELSVPERRQSWECGGCRAFADGIRLRSPRGSRPLDPTSGRPPSSTLRSRQSAGATRRGLTPDAGGWLLAALSHGGEMGFAGEIFATAVTRSRLHVSPYTRLCLQASINCIAPSPCYHLIYKYLKIRPLLISLRRTRSLFRGSRLPRLHIEDEGSKLPRLIPENMQLSLSRTRARDISRRFQLADTRHP